MNLGYHAAVQRGRAVRAAYVSVLPMIMRRRFATGPSIQADAYTYSGAAQLPEQVASLRSFLAHVGVPRRLVVVSDGSHGPEDLSLLRRVHPAIEIATSDPALR